NLEHAGTTSSWSARQLEPAPFLNVNYGALGVLRQSDRSGNGSEAMPNTIGWSAYVSDQPLRNAGFRYLFASALSVIRIFTGSYSIFPSTRSAITPSSIHSTNGPAIERSEHAGSPPLQARIQSR